MPSCQWAWIPCLACFCARDRIIGTFVLQRLIRADNDMEISHSELGIIARILSEPYSFSSKVARDGVIRAYDGRPPCSVCDQCQYRWL